MTMEYKSSPKRPYLLRAYYDWLVDNNFTPYLVVDASYYGVNVPTEYVKDGQIVLNISAGAVGSLSLGNSAIEFDARFQGIPRDIYVPMGAVLAIYARENGDGVMFEPEPIYDELDDLPQVEQPTNFENIVDRPISQKENKETLVNKTKEKKSASHLRIIK